MQMFRYRDGLVPNSCVISYVLIAYPSAVWGLAWSAGMVYILSVLLLAHVLITAAYLLHECIHNTIFRRPGDNERLGLLLAWITGACYAPYGDLKEKHLRHHADRADVVVMDYREILAANSRLRRLCQFMHWCCLPAVELFTHGLSMAAPFLLESRRHQRRKVVTVLLLRSVFFLCLALWDWRILPGYGIAYLLFIWVLGFMDAFQHRYRINLVKEWKRAAPEFDRDYEEEHTWSNLLSRRLPWLNMLVLNFCYHNVHHYKSGEPWYRLPRLHTERYAGRDGPVITLARQLRDYHRFRVGRVMGGDRYGVDERDFNTGAAGVSFLVGV